MSAFAFSGILILITSLSLGFFVFSRKPQTLLNRLWVYFNLALSLWGLSAFKIATTSDKDTAFIWFKIGQIGVIAIPPILLHFSMHFLEKLDKKIIYGFYSISTIFIVLLLNNFLVKDLKLIFNSYYFPIRPTFLYHLFFIYWLSLIIYTYKIVFDKIKISSIDKINEIKYFFLCVLIGYIGGITNFLPLFGIYVYPYGNFLVGIFPILITLCIYKYKLLNIDVIFRKSLIYSILVASITLLFSLSLLLFERFFNQFIHNLNLTTYLITSSLITLIFIPLKNKIQDFVDRAFFRATTLEMAEQNQQFREEATQSERLKSIAILASGIAHEIKNPLTPIKTFSEQLPYRLEDKDFLVKFSKIITKEIDRIDSLVQDLLLFAKPSSPILTEININQLADQTLDLLNNQLIRYQIKLEKHYENINPLLKIDTKQIKQALLNIFLNAIDAMQHGGILKIKTYISTTTLTLPNSFHYINIEISDTGHGIDSHDIPHIFDPFYTKKNKGTGLGLFVTYEIIKNHQGKIFATSLLGKGTTFRIELPAQSSFL